MPTIDNGDAAGIATGRTLHGVFECRRCGACCRIKDGIVRVSDEEVAQIAAFLGMDENDFIERETEVAPDRKSLMLKSRPDGSCAYLDSDNLCRINPVKPEKCRTFPFEWTNSDSSSVCPALAELSPRAQTSLTNGAPSMRDMPEAAPSTSP